MKSLKILAVVGILAAISILNFSVTSNIEANDISLTELTSIAHAFGEDNEPTCYTVTECDTESTTITTCSNGNCVTTTETTVVCSTTVICY